MSQCNLCKMSIVLVLKKKKKDISKSFTLPGQTRSYQRSDPSPVHCSFQEPASVFGFPGPTSGSPSMLTLHMASLFRGPLVHFSTAPHPSGTLKGFSLSCPEFPKRNCLPCIPVSRHQYTFKAETRTTLKIMFLTSTCSQDSASFWFLGGSFLSFAFL